MTLNINLTPQLELMVRERVSSGRYNSASEVIREALRIMETQEQLHVAKLQRLRQDIREGLESGHARPWKASAVKRTGRAALRNTRRAQAPK